MEKDKGESLSSQEENNKLSRFQREIERLSQKVKELPVMHEINRDIASLSKIDEILGVIIDRATSMLESEIGSILLFVDNSHKELVIRAARGLSDEIIRNTRVPLGEGVSGWVAQTGLPLLITDISKNSRFTRKDGKYYTNSLISVPLEVGGKVIGVININNKKTKETFTKEDLELLKTLAVQASVAVEIAELFKNLHDSYLHTIEALTAAIDAKDHYTCHHSRQVTGFAVAIAREMHLPDKEIEAIRKACQLHDLGKIGIHDHILTKPGKLTQQEWKEMQTHPLKGVEILKPLGSLNEIIYLVKEHHERFDGQGYPNGLEGNNIRLGARIIAVADAFSAMISNRPYRKKMPREEAMEEVSQQANHQFDPEVVRSFLKAAQNGKIVNQVNRER